MTEEITKYDTKTESYETTTITFSEKSESVQQLATALSKAQSETNAALKDSTNPFFNSKYADFASVWEASRIPLTKNGLSVSQIPISRDGLYGVKTILMHSSGEWISGELLLPSAKHDPQSIGSVITYAKRYSLSGIVCLATEDDDDGNKGSGKEAPLAFIAEKQVSQITDMINDKNSDEAKFCEYFKIESVDKMPASKFNEAVKLLKAKKKVEKAAPVKKAEEDLKALIDKKNKELGVDEPGSRG
jgi:hypothetical protein